MSPSEPHGKGSQMSSPHAWGGVGGMGEQTARRKRGEGSACVRVRIKNKSQGRVVERCVPERERTVRVGAARPRVADVGVAARRRVVGRNRDGEATGDDGREVVDARGGDAKGRARVAKGDVARLAVDEEVVAAKVGDGGERGADEEAGEEAHGVEVDATALSCASLKMRAVSL